MIIENSLDFILKKKLEKKYQNVKILIPKKNLGISAAINLASKNIKTKYILYTSIDVNLDTSKIYELLLRAKTIKNFGSIIPKMTTQLNFKSFYIKKIDNSLFLTLPTTATVFLMQKKIIDKVKFDENFFSYFEETDFFRRCHKYNYFNYSCTNVLIKHFKGKSINKDLSFEYNKYRNWHYCWSKFYYVKKHYSYLKAISKTWPNFLKSLKSIVVCILKLDFQKIPLYYCEINGLINSYCLNRPFYRIKN